MSAGGRRPRVFTIGHRSVASEDFLRLIESAGINLLVDIRSNPAASRSFFVRHALSSTLEEMGVTYRWFRNLGEEKPFLAGSRDHAALGDERHRSYTEAMNTAVFARSCEELVGLISSSVSVILGGTAHPYECHRRYLSDKLVTMGVRVVHLVPGVEPVIHSIHPGLEMDGDRMVYRGRQLSLI